MNKLKDPNSVESKLLNFELSMFLYVEELNLITYHLRCITEKHYLFLLAYLNELKNN